ncbi:MAG TPA: hypothetical protein VM049_08015 [Gaiellaceae bacterium]|nr:hypothetical protein [Gaiellaceae bacterium]
MSEQSAVDFGSGLRAHLGLERAELDLVPEPEAPVEPVAATVDAPGPDAAVTEQFEALAALEAELLERERKLTLREATLASRAGSLLAAAQALYDDVLGGGPSPHDDELGRLRRRKSVA